MNSIPPSNPMANLMNTVSGNRSYIGIAIFLILLAVYLVYRKYRDIVNNEKKEPVFIRSVRRGDKSIDFKSELIPAPAYGSAYTYTVWLYVNDITSSSQYDRLKHVFHKGSDIAGGFANFKCSPGVWLLPNSNNMMVVVDTDNNANGICNYKFTMQSKLSGIDEGSGKINVLRIVKSNDGSYIYLAKDGSNLKVVKTYDINGNNMSYYKGSKLDIMTEVEKFKEKDLANYTQLVNGYDIRAVTSTSIKECVQNTLSNKIIVENIPMQRWFHLVIVADESAMEVYIDGKLHKTVVLSGSPRLNDGNLYVSQKNSSTSSELAGFDGLVNELRYYPRALSYSDIYTMYARGPTPFYFKDMMKDKYEKLEDDYYLTANLKEAQSYN